jgi:hypothetical protein
MPRCSLASSLVFEDDAGQWCSGCLGLGYTLFAPIPSHGAAASRAVDVNLMQRQNGNQAVERAFFGLSKNRDTSWPGLVIAALNLP